MKKKKNVYKEKIKKEEDLEHTLISYTYIHVVNALTIDLQLLFDIRLHI